MNRNQFALAAEVAPLVNPQRLRLARETHGWTQRVLSTELDGLGHPLTSAAISQLETGATRPSPRTLAAIADATGFPVDYFVRRQTDTEAAGFFRSLRSTPARERSRALARAHLLHDFGVALEHYIDLPDRDIPRWPIVNPTSEDIEHVAMRVRRSWGLGAGPIDEVLVEIERHGAIAARVILERSDVDAFSAWFPDRPVVVLGKDKASYVRSRFDAAHELGHLVLHGPEQAGTKEAERQAHDFAASFLMPAASIADRLPASANWGQLMELKATWGVSMGALLYRSKKLGLMGDARYTSAMKYMSAKGWRKEEPGDRASTPEQPRLISSALRLLRREGIELDDIAAQGALPVPLVREIIDGVTESRRRVDL